MRRAAEWWRAVRDGRGPARPAQAAQHPRGALRDATAADAPYWWDHALGRLTVLADRAEAEAAADPQVRHVDGTTERSLRQVRAHLVEARLALVDGDVDAAEAHYGRALVHAGSWRPGSDLAAHLEGTGRSLFGLEPGEG